MAFCRYCGASVGEGDQFCPNCGKAQSEAQKSECSTTQAPSSDDSGSFGWAVLGFLVPIVGLILWIVWHDERPKNAHKAGVGALVGFILPIVLVIGLIAWAAYMGATAEILALF